MASEAEDLHRVVPPATSWILGVTLRLWKGGGDGGDGKVGLRVVKGFVLTRIRIFGCCGIWVS